MPTNDNAVIVHGVKITEQLTKILSEISETGIEQQKNMLARNGLLIAGLNDPGIIPIDQEFFLVIQQIYQLLCSLEDPPEKERNN